MKCPVLLINEGHLTKLIILHAREEVCHSGVVCTYPFYPNVAKRQF